MTNDLTNPANCACFNVRRAARKLTQIYDGVLKPSGLLSTQFSLLATLDMMNDAPGVAMNDLADRMGMNRTTLTRNLALVAKNNWVTIVAGEDQRERLVKLTPEGRAVLKSALPYWREAQASVSKALGDDSLHQFLGLTQRLNSG